MSMRHCLRLHCTCRRAFEDL